MIRPLVPNLWCDGNAEEIASFYASVFPDSRVVGTTRYPEAAPGETGSVMTVDLELAGQRFVLINGGPQFTFSEAVSFAVTCESQEEVDRYWAALSADGGQEGPCGWCKDRFGLSWQVVPDGMEEVMEDPDPERRERAFAAMMTMTRLDIHALRAAADGAAAPVTA